MLWLWAGCLEAEETVFFAQLQPNWFRNVTEAQTAARNKYLSAKVKMSFYSICFIVGQMSGISMCGKKVDFYFIYFFLFRSSVFNGLCGLINIFNAHKILFNPSAYC